MSDKSDNKRIQLVLTKEQYDLIQRMKGELGTSDSEVVRNIILAWLTEKSFISSTLKQRLFGNDGRP